MDWKNYYFKTLTILNEIYRFNSHTPMTVFLELQKDSKTHMKTQIILHSQSNPEELKQSQ